MVGVKYTGRLLEFYSLFEKNHRVLNSSMKFERLCCRFEVVCRVLQGSKGLGNENEHGALKGDKV